MSSIWYHAENPIKFEQLKGNKKTDVLIIGGGMAGILCAYMLERAGVDYLLVEADKICRGITRNTTAKITLQHGFIYDKLIRIFGVEGAKLYYNAHNDALKQYENICGTVPCDYKKCDSFAYTRDNREKAKKEFSALEKIGCKAEFCDSMPLEFSIKGAVKIKNQAQFNPLKFAFSIARDLNILENTKILEITSDGALTNNGKIISKKTIVATHFPFVNKYGSYFLKMYQHRSYVIAYKNAPQLNGMYVDEDDKGMSFRNYNDLLLIGGGGHRTGKKGGNWHEIEDFARKHYPQAKQVCRFATQDCMSLDGVAYIGKYSKSTPDLYVATGFNKWGMSSSMVSALILRDLVQGKENIYASLFSPSRSMMHPQFAFNIAESFIGMVRPTVPRCPHLGCALKYNKYEHSWDCSCHGSRFTESGELINGPATDDKKL